MTSEAILTASNLASFVLSIIAIILSVLFFVLAKNAEKETTKALEGIRSQTDTLRDITSKQMTRLIRNVTEQKPVDEILTIISAVRNVPDTNLQLHLKQQEIEQLTALAVEGYIAAYYYSAVSNFFAQLNLPTIDNFDSQNPVHGLVKDVVDMSIRDFNNLGMILSKVDPARIQTNSSYSYYVSAQQFWASHLKDSVTHFAEEQKQQPT